MTIMQLANWQAVAGDDSYAGLLVECQKYCQMLKVNLELCVTLNSLAIRNGFAIQLEGSSNSSGNYFYSIFSIKSKITQLIQKDEAEKGPRARSESPQNLSQ